MSEAGVGPAGKERSGQRAKRARSGTGKAGFHAPHLARHFGLSSAPEAIPAGKVIPLVSDLAHSEPPPCPFLGTLTTSRSQIWDFRKKTLPLHSHITPWWWNGRHEGLKIPWPETAVRVRFPPEARAQLIKNQLVALCFYAN